MGKNHKGGSAITQRAARTRKGSLIVIGGGEDKKGDMLILHEVAQRVNSGALAVATVATRLADELWSEYEKVFHELGTKGVVHLAVENREEAVTEDKVHVLDNVNVVFFTGGDQLKITSKLGGTRVHDRIQEIYNSGGTIAGTSAGASALSETMLVSGPGNETNRIGQDLFMAPGFGFATDMIIDQHFAERGRIGRLLGAVARNPRLLGVGIDEDTAIVIDGKEQFQVIGSGGVYVLDGHSVNLPTSPRKNPAEPCRSSVSGSIYSVREICLILRLASPPVASRAPFLNGSRAKMTRQAFSIGLEDVAGFLATWRRSIYQIYPFVISGFRRKASCPVLSPRLCWRGFVSAQHHSAPVMRSNCPGPSIIAPSSCVCRPDFGSVRDKPAQ